jgi:hypothetical protein
MRMANGNERESSLLVPSLPFFAEVEGERGCVSVNINRPLKVKVLLMGKGGQWRGRK